MIVADTSIWVAAFRNERSDEARTLTTLLDADEIALPVPVRSEMLSGASTRDSARLKRTLSALPLLYPTDATWKTIESMVERGQRTGAHFGLGDLLIGALAVEAGALLWSLDSDFVRMSRLKLLDVYEP